MASPGAETPPSKESLAWFQARRRKWQQSPRDQKLKPFKSPEIKLASPVVLVSTPLRPPSPPRPPPAVTTHAVAATDDSPDPIATPHVPIATSPSPAAAASLAPPSAAAAAPAPASPATKAPSPPPQPDHRARLVEFYQKHNPDKLSSVDQTLATYQGREEELFRKLQQKYATTAAAIPQPTGPICFLEFPQGQVRIQLYEETPLASENFRRLCLGQDRHNGQRLCYRNCVVHRIVPNFCVQLGDFDKGDGTGGRSIYTQYDALWGKFPDDATKLPHAAKGYVSMANNGPDRNGSQFFFTLRALPHLNGKHVVFGKVVGGMDVVEELATLETNAKQRPLEPPRVLDCGEVESDTGTLIRASEDNQPSAFGSGFSFGLASAASFGGIASQAASSSGFGAISGSGQTSSFGTKSIFGQASTLGADKATDTTRSESTSAAPSLFGHSSGSKPSIFGQSSSIGDQSSSTPSVSGGSSSTMFGQSSTSKPVFGQTSSLGGASEAAPGSSSSGTSSSLFGQTPKTIFGQTSSPGGSDPTPVSSSTTSLFGQSSGSIFGQTSALGSSGSTPTGSASTALFSQSSKSSTIFGKTSSQGVPDPSSSTSVSSIFGQTSKLGTPQAGQASNTPVFGQTSSLGGTNETAEELTAPVSAPTTGFGSSSAFGTNTTFSFSSVASSGAVGFNTVGAQQRTLELRRDDARIGRSTKADDESDEEENESSVSDDSVPSSVSEEYADESDVDGVRFCKPETASQSRSSTPVSIGGDGYAADKEREVQPRAVPASSPESSSHVGGHETKVAASMLTEQFGLNTTASGDASADGYFADKEKHIRHNKPFGSQARSEDGYSADQEKDDAADATTSGATPTEIKQASHVAIDDDDDVKSDSEASSPLSDVDGYSADREKEYGGAKQRQNALPRLMEESEDGYSADKEKGAVHAFKMKHSGVDTEDSFSRSLSELGREMASYSDDATEPIDGKSASFSGNTDESNTLTVPVPRSSEPGGGVEEPFPKPLGSLGIDVLKPFGSGSSVSLKFSAPSTPKQVEVPSFSFMTSGFEQQATESTALSNPEATKETGRGHQSQPEASTVSGGNAQTDAVVEPHTAKDSVDDATAEIPLASATASAPFVFGSSSTTDTGSFVFATPNPAKGAFSFGEPLFGSGSSPTKESSAKQGVSFGPSTGQFSFSSPKTESASLTEVSFVISKTKGATSVRSSAVTNPFASKPSKKPIASTLQKATEFVYETPPRRKSPEAKESAASTPSDERYSPFAARTAFSFGLKQRAKQREKEAKKEGKSSAKQSDPLLHQLPRDEASTLSVGKEVSGMVQLQNVPEKTTPRKMIDSRTKPTGDKSELKTDPLLANINAEMKPKKARP